jgi:hypothetical protein
LQKEEKEEKERRKKEKERKRKRKREIDGSIVFDISLSHSTFVLFQKSALVRFRHSIQQTER